MKNKLKHIQTHAHIPKKEEEKNEHYSTLKKVFFLFDGSLSTISMS